MTTYARLLPDPLVRSGAGHNRRLSIIEAIRVAFAALLANRMRSLLTMLGVIVGVSAVIVMLALAEGARRETEKVIRKMGTNRLYIRPEEAATRGVRMGAGTAESLTAADVPKMLELTPSVSKAVPEYRGSGARIKYKNRNTMTTIYGSTPEYFELNNIEIVEGRPFNRQEEAAKARVAVIGHETWQTLFGDQSPIGKTIRINGQSFQVIGLQKRLGEMMFRNRDDQLVVPLGTAMRRLFGAEYISSINAQAASEKQMVQAEEEIYAAMRRIHRLRPEEPDNIKIYNQADLLQSADQQAEMMKYLLGGIAMVSLLVGGIGIMNIMLVSVTERTREIGIRKALGARRRDILYQFLIESVSMSAVGGLIGILFAVLVATWMAMPADQGGFGMPMQLTSQPMVVSFFFSGLVGIFFGIYPALKASALDPIEALRYE